MFTHKVLQGDQDTSERGGPNVYQRSPYQCKDKKGVQGCMLEQCVCVVQEQ